MTDDDEEDKKAVVKKKVETKSSKTSVVEKPSSKKVDQTNLDLLLSLEESVPTMSSPQNVLSPTMGGMLTPMGPLPTAGFESAISEAAPMFTPTKSVELLNKMSSGGLQVLQRFTRSPHLYSHAMCNIQVITIFTLSFDKLPESLFTLHLKIKLQLVLKQWFD